MPYPTNTIEYWITIENRAWDVCPEKESGFTPTDRMSGLPISGPDGASIHGPAASADLTSPVTGVSRINFFMNYPAFGIDDVSRKANDGLILRRYTSNWAKPDDRKVNPWDINEPDPTDSGTMGTIPGPTLECSVGDRIIVHFKNLDKRTGLDALITAHSLHTHGITYSNKHDGAYPLSPEDDSNDPRTSTPVKLNPITPDEKDFWATVDVSGTYKQGDRVPVGGTFTYVWDTLNWPTTAGVWLYHDHSFCDMSNVMSGAIGALVIHNPLDGQDVDIRSGTPPFNPDPAFLPGGSPNGSPIIKGKYVTPSKAMYIQLFHELGNASFCINGRKYLGNTPTLVAGPKTLMRFGVIGMGQSADSHTFHIHGHRWIVPGPHGNDPDSIKNSKMDTPVTQFEDTRIFGPANSFVFTIRESSLVSGDPSDGMGAGMDPRGEWHMHCHVMEHMGNGMMGSLLVVENNQDAVELQEGKGMCSMPSMGGTQVQILDNSYSPPNISITKGQTVTWTNTGVTHTVTSNPGILYSCGPSSSENFNSGDIPTGKSWSHTFNTSDTYNYHCERHGCTMAGKVTVTDM